MNKANFDIDRLWEQMIHWNPRLKQNAEQRELITKKLQKQLIQSHAVVMATKLDLEYEEVAKRCESKIYELKRFLGQSSSNHSTRGDIYPINELAGEDVKVEELQDSDCDSNEKLSVIAKRSQKSRSSEESRAIAAKNSTLVDTEQMPVALRKAPRKRKTPSNYKFQSSPTKSSFQDHSIIRQKQSVIYCNEEEVNCNHEPQHSLYIEMPSLFVWHPKHRIRLGNKVNQLVFGNVVNQAKQKASRQDTSVVQQEKDLMTTFCSSSVSTYQQNQEEIEFSQFVEDIMIGDGSEDEETWQAARALECINNNALDNLDTTVERHLPLSQSSLEVPILCEPTTSKKRRKSVKPANNGPPKKRGRKPKNKDTFAVEPPTKSNLAQYVENFANDCDLRGSTTPAASSTMSQPLVTSTTQNFEFIDQQNSRSVMCYFEGDWPNGTACQFLTTNGLTINGTQVEAENVDMNPPVQDNTLDGGSIELPISIPITSLEFENFTNSRPIQTTSELQNSLVQPVFNIQIPPLPAFSTTTDTSSISNGAQYPPPAHTATDCALDLSAKSKETDVSNALLKFSNLSNQTVMSIEQTTDDDIDNAPLDLSVKPVTMECIENTGPPAGQDQELSDFQYVVEHDGQFYDFTRCLHELGFDDNGKPNKGKDMPLLDCNVEPNNVLIKDSTKPLSFDSNYITMADETSDNQTSILGQEFQFANRSTKEIFDNLLDICDENDNESNVPFLGFDNITFDSNEIQNSTACGVLDNVSKEFDVDKFQDKNNDQEPNKDNAIEISISQTLAAITNNANDKDFPIICESSLSTTEKGDDNHLLNIFISAENKESTELPFKVTNDTNINEFVEDLSKSSRSKETPSSNRSKTVENYKETGEKCPEIVSKSTTINGNVDKCVADSRYMRTESPTAVLARSNVDGCHYENAAESLDKIDITVHTENCNINTDNLTVSVSKFEPMVEDPNIKPILATKFSKTINNSATERTMQGLDCISSQKTYAGPPTTDIELPEVESIPLVTKSNSINCDKSVQSKNTETDSTALKKKIVFSVAKVDLRDVTNSLHYMFANGSDANRKKAKDINLLTDDDNIFNSSNNKNTSATSEVCSDSSLPTRQRITEEYKVNVIENHTNDLQSTFGKCEYSKKMVNCFGTGEAMSLVDENAALENNCIDILKDNAFPKLNSSVNSVIIGDSSIIVHTKDTVKDKSRQVNPNNLLQNENKNDVSTGSSMVLEETAFLKANIKDNLQSQQNQILEINNFKISDNDKHCTTQIQVSPSKTASSEDFNDDRTTSEVCEDSDQECVKKNKCLPNGQAGTISKPTNLEFLHMSLLEMESNLEQENLDYDEDFDDALSLETSCFNSPNDNRFMEPLVYESDSSTIEPSSSITPNITNVITSSNHTTIPKINATPSAEGLKNFKIPLLKKSITAELPTREGTRKQSITCKGVSDINHFTLQPSVRLERICFSEDGKIIQKKSVNSEVSHIISNHVPIRFENFTRTIQNETSPAATTSGDISPVQQQPHHPQSTQTVKCIFGKNSSDVEKQRLPLSTIGNDVVTNDIAEIFGITCFPYLADLCDKPPTLCGHSHQLNNKDTVLTTLSSLNNVQLVDAYSFMYNNQKLYKSYFLVFCKLYTMRKDRDKLLSMVTDCERYPQYSEFVILLYEGLLNVGLNRANACRLLLQQCREKTPQFIDALVAIIMKSDWTMFTNYIENYALTEYRFRFGTLDQMSRSVLKSNDVHLKQVFGKCVQMLHKDDTVLLASMPNVLEWVNLLMNP